MAATAMMHCGPTHYGVQVAQPKAQELPDALQSAHAAHGHASHAAAHARTAGHTGQNATPLDASGTAQPGKATDPVKVTKATYQKCSACASCCAGVALPSTAVMPPMIDPAREVTVLLPSCAASVVIDGPERPPRILRA